MKIALAFSGGGVRATVFHLGVLARLAREDLLPKVKILSSVSGGSLAAGLVFARAGFCWPSSRQYLHDVVPQIHSLLTSRDVQRSYVIKSLMFPWRIAQGRAAVLGDELERQWGITGKLADLPIAPEWIVNATCYQTGKNWRFQRDLMGDYQTKYITNPDFRLSHALAASAAVPGLIGPLIVKSRRHQWSEFRDDDWHSIEPKYRRLHLWDGGVYDNLGVEALFKPGDGLREGTDFLIVCDASRPLAAETRASRWRPGYLKASMRLVDVATDQVRSLRARMLIEFFKQNPGSGAYLRLGLKTKSVYARSKIGGQPALTDQEVGQASAIETTLRRLTHEEFSLLFRHGFEVADATMIRHCEQVLNNVPRKHVQFKVA
ncbi:patatin-like phospholipase family protein [Rubripirellula reticaptiva]|uniref:Patatin-like phospholipase n=1 Tax=Rubripirellula reticaptiva TaxID=2528013 RepID=A0A5C6FCN7_9BACT|nr:patatin-like phospholipase family protein [Rubripirellula reticaptiva]TWU57866.1 Patatin-like phospholipase [Rubripirellula reticaptiva]